jgi:hypothetical protein
MWRVAGRVSTLTTPALELVTAGPVTSTPEPRGTTAIEDSEIYLVSLHR